MARFPLLLICACVTILTAWPMSDARGQLGAGPQLELSGQARISLLTIYPGDAVHAWFGHSALRVHDPALGLDLAFNYGEFDYDAPFFPLRFARGQLDYQLGVAETGAMLMHYQAVDRAVVEQDLNLNGDQRQALFGFLATNALPEHRTYRYRFLDDNCATRVRDAVEAALGDAVRFDAVEPAGASYRQMLASYVADRPATWLGMTLLLGMDAEEAVTARETMFLPLPMRDAFELGEVRHEGADWQPLVADQRRLHWNERAERIERTSRPSEPAWPWPTMLSFAALGLAGAGTIWRWRGERAGGAAAKRPADRAARWLDVGLLSLVGLAGLLMLVLWTLTEHDMAAWNLNLLWAWPTHAVAGAVLALAGVGRVRRWLGVYFAVAGTAALVVALAWPVVPQALPVAAWPVALLVALRAGRLAVKCRGDG